MDTTTSTNTKRPEGRFSLKPPVVDTLEEERERLKREMWNPEGTHCKACEQMVKVYHRNMYDKQAIALVQLVKLWLLSDKTWIHVTELPIMHGRHGGGDFAKLEHYGLIESKPSESPGAKRCSGMWKPTETGCEFEEGDTKLPTALLIYNNKVVGYDEGSMISIYDVLPDGFNYPSIWDTEEAECRDTAVTIHG